MKLVFFGCDAENIEKTNDTKLPHCWIFNQWEKSSEIKLFSVKGFNIWMDDWKDRGWRRADKKPVKNRQLWQQVDELSSRKYVEVFKVKAHSGIEGNERADLLAVEAD